MLILRRRPVWTWLIVLALILALSASPISAQTLPQASGGDSSDAAPQSVELNYFIGTAHPGYILLEWESVSELNTQAFRIYRATVDDPSAAIYLDPPGVVTAHLGSVSGYYYSWQDSYNLTPGVTYYYWLEDQDVNNIWTRHLDANLVPVVPYCSLYDVNCSLTVDLADITLVANAWQCSVFDSCYATSYDLDGSYYVLVNDVMQVAAHWSCNWADTCYW